MGGRCHFGVRAPDDITLVFGNQGYARLRISLAALVLLYHGWLEEPFHKGVGWDGVAFSAHSRKDVRCLIIVSSNMMKLELLEPS